MRLPAIIWKVIFYIFRKHKFLNWMKWPNYPYIYYIRNSTKQQIWSSLSSNDYFSLFYTFLSEPKLPNQTQNEPWFHQLRRPGLSLDFLFLWVFSASVFMMANACPLYCKMIQTQPKQWNTSSLLLQWTQSTLEEESLKSQQAVQPMAAFGSRNNHRFPSNCIWLKHFIKHLPHKLNNLMLL